MVLLDHSAAIVAIRNGFFFSENTVAASGLPVSCIRFNGTGCRVRAERNVVFAPHQNGQLCKRGWKAKVKKVRKEIHRQHMKIHIKTSTTRWVLLSQLHKLHPRGTLSDSLNFKA